MANLSPLFTDGRRQMQKIPEAGFLRLPQIIGQKAITPEQAERNRAAGRRGRRARPERIGLIPVSAATWWEGVKSGRYPQPVKHGRATLWRAEDIRDLVARIGESNAE